MQKICIAQRLLQTVLRKVTQVIFAPCSDTTKVEESQQSQQWFNIFLSGCRLTLNGLLKVSVAFTQLTVAFYLQRKDTVACMS